MKVELTPFLDNRHKSFKNEIERLRLVKPSAEEQESTLASSVKRQAITSGIEPYSGEWGEEQAAHLLRRTLFGVRRSEMQHFASLNMSEAVEILLTQSSTPNPPINDYNSYSDNPDPDVPEGESWIEAPYNNELEGLRIYSLKSWIVHQMLHQETTIHQKLVMFWHNLLPTQMWGVFFAKTSYKYWKMLFDSAFGNYQDLIKKLTQDPCMLIYLNGTANNKNAPDENYARELQELFCIGKGSGSGYTESDVQAAARVLTGWVVYGDSVFNNGEPQSFFYSDWHDTNDKHFSSFYGNIVISGKSGDEGAEELDELLNMIFSTDEIALYICRRLYNFFVYHEIDTTTETNFIVPLAQIFRDNNYDILPVLETLFKSAHFFDVANMGATIKNPADHLIGLWRSLEIPQKGIGEENNAKKLLRGIYTVWDMAERGMEIGDPPNVAGWKAYYQEPSFDKIWITSDSIQSRVSRQDNLLQYGLVYRGLQLSNFSLIGLMEEISEPTLPRVVISESAELLLGLPLSQKGIDNLESILSPVVGEWTLAWYDYLGEPSNDMYREVVEARLRATFRSMLQLGEFQLM